MPAFTGALHQPGRLLQASEWVASWTTYGLLLAVSKGCVRLLTDQITVVASLTPRQIDRGDVGWPYTRRQKQGSTEAGPVGKEEYDSSFSYSQYNIINKYLSSIFKITLIMNSKTDKIPNKHLAPYITPHMETTFHSIIISYLNLGAHCLASHRGK